MEQNLLRSAVKGNSFNFKDMFSEIAPLMADHANAVAEFSARLSKMVRDGTIDDVEKAQLAAMAEPMFKTIMELV